MTARWRCVTLGFFLGCVTTQPLQAETIDLQVVDQTRTPLSGAVIEVPGVSPGAAGSELAIVDQVDKRFVPELRLIQAGQRVSFPNSDNIRHHVYSFSPAKTFELKLYSGKPEKPIRFEQPGVVVLGCNIHDSMVGYIYIAETMAVVTDADGRAQLPLQGLQRQVYLWHALQEGGPQQRQLVKLPEQGAPRVLQLTTQPAEPRDTFRDKFGAGGSP